MTVNVYGETLASADDLAAALGLSASRVRHLIRAHGVEAAWEQPTGARPRKMYRPADLIGAIAGSDMACRLALLQRMTHNIGGTPMPAR